MNDWYDVYNGEIKANTLIQIIEHNKCVTIDGHIKSFVDIYLPDGRNVEGVYESNTEGWSIEWILNVFNRRDSLYGIVQRGKIEYPIRTVDKHGNIIFEVRGDDRQECIKKSLQTFLFDNKYKIAVI